MTTFFLDTSALIKRYKNEDGSDFMDELFSGKERLLVSTLSIVELISNLRRLVDIPADHSLSEQEFSDLRSIVLQDIAEGRIEPVELTTTASLIAMDIVAKRYTKPIDALQIAMALDEQIDDLVILSADQGLNKRAIEEGIQVLDPTSDRRIDGKREEMISAGN